MRRFSRRELLLFVPFLMLASVLLVWQWHTAVSETGLRERMSGKAAVRAIKTPISAPIAAEGGGASAGAAVADDVACRCPRDCIDYQCDGTSRAKSPRMMLATMSFSRCTACMRMGKSRTSCGSAKWMSYADATAKCGERGLDFAKRVRWCLSQNMTVPSEFALDVDDVSGAIYASLKESRVTEQIRRTQLYLLDGAAQKLEEERDGRRHQARAFSEPPPYRFVDFGYTDPKLDAQVAALRSPLDDGAPGPFLFTVETYPLTTDLRQLEQLTGCLNQAGNFARVELGSSGRLYHDWPDHAATFGVDDASSTSSSPTLRNVPSDRPTIFRFNAAGYDLHFQDLIVDALDALKPVVILANPSVVDEKGNGIAKWLTTRNYVAHNTLTCHSTNKMEQLWRLHVQSLRDKGQAVVWAKEEDRRLVRPRCPKACIDLVCIDRWRSEYRPCSREAICGSVEGASGCAWNSLQTACPHDQQFPVVLGCSNPDLPVPVFSVVHTMELQVMCQGAQDCDFHNKHQTESLARTFKSMLQGVQEMFGSAEFVDIGSFVGLIPFWLAKEGYKAHLFEAEPQLRHLLEMTKCYGRHSNARVYDVGVGGEDELCYAEPTTEAAVGKTVFSCGDSAPNAAAANRSELLRGRIPQRFQKLDTIYATHFQGTKRWPGFMRFNIGARAAAAIRGGRKWLCEPNRQPLYVAIHVEAGELSDKDAAAIYDTLHDCGYTRVSIFEESSNRNDPPTTTITSKAAFVDAVKAPLQLAMFRVEATDGGGRRH